MFELAGAGLSLEPSRLGFVRWAKQLVMAENIRQAILDLLQERGPGKSICPSDVVRRVFPDSWRDHLDLVRQEARVMARLGHIRITRGDQQLDPNQPFGGPIRLRLPHADERD